MQRKITSKMFVPVLYNPLSSCWYFTEDPSGAATTGAFFSRGSLETFTEIKLNRRTTLHVIQTAVILCCGTHINNDFIGGLSYEVSDEQLVLTRSPGEEYLSWKSHLRTVIALIIYRPSTVTHESINRRDRKKGKEAKHFVFNSKHSWTNNVYRGIHQHFFNVIIHSVHRPRKVFLIGDLHSSSCLSATSAISQILETDNNASRQKDTCGADCLRKCRTGTLRYTVCWYFLLLTLQLLCWNLTSYCSHPPTHWVSLNCTYKKRARHVSSSESAVCLVPEHLVDHFYLFRSVQQHIRPQCDMCRTTAIFGDTDFSFSGSFAY